MAFAIGMSKWPWLGFWTERVPGKVVPGKEQCVVYTSSVRMRVIREGEPPEQEDIERCRTEGPISVGLLYDGSHHTRWW